MEESSNREYFCGAFDPSTTQAYSETSTANRTGFFFVFYGLMGQAPPKKVGGLTIFDFFAAAPKSAAAAAAPPPPSSMFIIMLLLLLFPPVNFTRCRAEILSTLELRPALRGRGENAQGEAVTAGSGSGV